MSDEKKAAKPAKEVKEKVLTISSVFKELAQKGAKDRKALAAKIFAHMKSKGVENNVRGKPLTEEKILSQVSAMVRDINAKRGEGKNGWWSTFEVVESDTEFKIKAKA